MTVINCDDIIGKKFNTITNNVFCLSHPKNCLIVGKTNSGKTNILMTLIAQNSIYEKTYIYTNNLDDKYSWLKNKFKNDVFIYINEINFDKINKEYVNLIIFDDLVFSNKKISEFYCRSRKLNCSTVFIGHRYFENIDRTLKNNFDYLIFTQLDKKELNMLYQDINLDISLKEFQDINTNLKKYEFILIDKYNEHKFMRIRKNLNQIYICKWYIIMINGLDIYYSKNIGRGLLKPISKTASGLKPISNKQKANGLKPISKGKGCKKVGRGLKILQ